MIYIDKKLIESQQTKLKNKMRKSKRDYNKKNRFRTLTPSNYVGEDSLKYESFHYNTVFNPSKPHFMLLLQQGE